MVGHIEDISIFLSRLTLINPPCLVKSFHIDLITSLIMTGLPRVDVVINHNGRSCVMGG